MTTPAPSRAVVDGVDVDAVAAAVRGCRSVDDLDAGLLGSAATYLPGRRIQGISVGEERVAIQVRGRWGASVHEMSTEIRAALAPLVAGRKIDVTISDIADPPGLSPGDFNPGGA